MQPHADTTESGGHASRTPDVVRQAATPLSSPPNMAAAFGRPHLEAVGRGRYDAYLGVAREDEWTVTDNGPHHPELHPAQQGRGAWHQSREHTDIENDHSRLRSTIGIVEALYSWAQTLKLECLSRIERHRAPQSSYGLSILLISTMVTGFFSYRAYSISRWQALYHFYDFCQRLDVSIVGGFTSISTDKHSSITYSMKNVSSSSKSHSLHRHTVYLLIPRSHHYLLFTIAFLPLPLYGTGTVFRSV